MVHLSPTAGAVDVFLTAVGADLAAATPTYSGLTYRGVSAYTAIAAGTYQLRAVPAGTASAGRADAVSINLTGQVLPGGSARTFVTADTTPAAARPCAPLRSPIVRAYSRQRARQRLALPGIAAPEV